MQDYKQIVCAFARQGYDDRLFAGTSGNLSLYDREVEQLYITPSGYPYRCMTADDIVVIDLVGNLIEGKHKPSSEWRMHCEIYRQNPAVNAVVHTHSPNATAFAVRNCAIPVVLIEMLYFLCGDVPVAPYAPPGSEALGQAAAKQLLKRTSCLLQNHGVVAVGEDMDKAYLRAIYTEDAASICQKAMAMGSIVPIPTAEQNRIRREMGIDEE